MAVTTRETSERGVSGPDISDRRCPMCGHDGARPVRSVDGWRLSACDRCKFLYAPRIRTTPPPGPVSRHGDREAAWARHRQIRRVLAAVLPNDATVVDVGPGVERVDPSSISDPVDGVVLDHVLDRVANPRALVRSAADCLRPGGVMVVVVPNRWDARQLNPSWRTAKDWNPPDHINYFSATSLRRLLEEVGLEVEPFAFRALGPLDWPYVPRAAFEKLGLYPFGLNVFGRAPRT